MYYHSWRQIYWFQDGKDKANEYNYDEADTKINLLAYQETSNVEVVANNKYLLALIL